jgi:hypothetical protein
MKARQEAYRKAGFTPAPLCRGLHDAAESRVYKAKTIQGNKAAHLKGHLPDMGVTLACPYDSYKVSFNGLGHFINKITRRAL